MKYPLIEIHREHIAENAKKIVKLAAKYGVEIWGVTKVTCGHPDVARTLLDAGVASICDSRIENIKKMCDAGIDSYYTLVRIPMISEAEEVVKYTNCSLNSELVVLQALNDAAKKNHLIHDIILMVDLGDLREGIWSTDLLDMVSEILKLEHIRLKGLGVNLTCWGGVLPTEANMSQLVEHAQSIEKEFNLKL
ncbi:MAG: alanine racemase [Desulfovibrionales bacterium]|nr:alanine racemase [Desulfovibrionales bacterium]